MVMKSTLKKPLKTGALQKLKPPPPKTKTQKDARWMQAEQYNKSE